MAIARISSRKTDLKGLPRGDLLFFLLFYNDPEKNTEGETKS